MSRPPPYLKVGGLALEARPMKQDNNKARHSAPEGGRVTAIEDPAFAPLPKV